MPKSKTARNESGSVPASAAQDILEHAPIGIFTATPEGRYLSANPALARMYGYDSPQELIESVAEIGRQIYADPSDREEFMRVLSEKGEVFNYECRALRRDGSIIWTSRNTREVRDRNNTVVHYQGFVTEITERKRAEEKLRKAEETYRNIFLNAQVGMFRTDIKTGLVLDANDAVARFAGFRDRKEMLATPFSIAERYVNPEDREKMISLLKTHGEFTDFETPFRRNDGSIILIRFSARLVPNKGWIEGVSVDVTTQQQTDAALRESELFMRETQAIAKLGGWKTNPRTDTLIWNDGVYDIIEERRDYRPGLAEGVKYYRPEYLPALQSGLNNCLATGDPFTLEAEITTAKGNNRWVEVRAFARTDSEGGPMVMGTIQDITDRKQAEEALLESEEMQRKILQTVPDLIIRTDLEGTITFVNELAFPGLENVPETSICGKNIFSFIAEHDRSRAVENARARLEKDIGPQEYQLLLDDAVIDAEVNGAVILDKESRPTGMVYVIRDVSERRRAAMELQEKNILLEGILDNIPDLVSVKRPDLSIIRYNRSGYDFLGMSLEQARGRKCYELMGRTSPCQPCASLDAMRTKQLTGHENYYPKLGVHLHCQANPVIGADGRIEYVVELLRDITPRKLAEQERDKLHAHLMQAQKMESVGILAGGVAHDFNNLLHAMRGNIEMLLQGKSADCPETRRLESVTRSMDRAAQLVKQLLLFSRKAESKKVYVNLNHEVQEVARILERTIPKMIAVELHLDPSIWALFIDPVQIEQVLLNLASNAVDAMPDGGRLTIETANVEVDEGFVRAHPGSNSGRHVLLTVSDTGHGMDREIMDHVFDPFFTTKEVGKGTGLGLASVYGIVKAHGGYIQCYSEPGSGTTFRVYLPAVEQGDVAQVERIPEPSLRGGSETILVVDDEQGIRELTREVLEMLGYSVKMAANGEQAVDIYREYGQSIDLVLLDLNMPGMGGHKCLKELLRLDPEVKVVIASGYTANNHGKGTVSSGARGFIGKPYQLQELAVIVRATLDEKENACKTM